jgi:hypothetical protein
MAVVPVLAVIRQGEQSFVFVVQKQNGMAMAHRTPVVLGDTVGNNYSIVSGLSAGDKCDRDRHAVSGGWHAGDSAGRMRRQLPLLAPGARASAA